MDSSKKTTVKVSGKIDLIPLIHRCYTINILSCILSIFFRVYGLSSHRLKERVLLKNRESKKKFQGTCNIILQSFKNSQVQLFSSF